jgi:hypothetical protein
MVLPFVATHDRTHADYQQQWDTLVPKGYRPISISAFPGLKHLLTLRKIKLTSKGYRPIILSGYSVSNE